MARLFLSRKKKNSKPMLHLSHRVILMQRAKIYSQHATNISSDMYFDFCFSGKLINYLLLFTPRNRIFQPQRFSVSFFVTVLTRYLEFAAKQVLLLESGTKIWENIYWTCLDFVMIAPSTVCLCFSGYTLDDSSCLPARCAPSVFYSTWHGQHMAHYNIRGAIISAVWCGFQLPCGLCGRVFLILSLLKFDFDHK